jgi:hypothetical protein
MRTQTVSIRDVREFEAAWGADPDLPLLASARREYAALPK